MGNANHSAESMGHDRYIVERLIYLRELRGLTVAELARRSLMDISALGKVLRFERVLKADEFICLCWTLSVGMDYFFPDHVRRELADLNRRALDGRPLL